MCKFLLLAFVIMTTSIFAQNAPPVDAGVSQTLAKWRAANYSDVRYKLNITLEKGAPLMKGEIEVRVNLTENGAKNDLILDWRTTQFANDKDKPYAAVIQVNTTMMGKSLHSTDDTYYSSVKEHLIVSKEFLKTGENVINIQFASPIKTSGAAITRYVDKEDAAEYVYSLFVPSDASTAFPVFDQPDLKARFELSGTKPAGWRIISNAKPVWVEFFGPPSIENTQASSMIFAFEETKPISPYVFAFAAGNFEEFSVFGTDEEWSKKSLKEKQDLHKKWDGELSTNIYVRKSQAEKFKQHAAEVFRLNREGVKFLESYFDYKFPFPKYDLVLIPEFPFGGMEHAGATFLREDRVIFPTEPTKNDYITRANVIFHEAAHQWFGDTVTMRWFDDLWLKEGFAEFMAYKTLEKVLPEYNAWKIFYERNKQLAYLTDSTKGTTPIYQEIPNLSAAKSAYGNIVYRKAPSFLRQAELYLGEDKFQIAVRAFLKKHEFANAEWTDLVKEFEMVSGQDLKVWSATWVKKRGMPRFRVKQDGIQGFKAISGIILEQNDILDESGLWQMALKIMWVESISDKKITETMTTMIPSKPEVKTKITYFPFATNREVKFIFPNYQDYGYGIFLLDEKSRAYVLANIQTEKDDFLRTMMWGSLWDSVREAELAPADYVRLVIKNINVETDESTIQTLLARVSTAMNYYIPEGGNTHEVSVSQAGKKDTLTNVRVSASERDELAAQLETLLIDKMQNAPTLGLRITFYRSFLNTASSDRARRLLKDILSGKSQIKDLKLKTKDKFDIVTRLAVLNDADAPRLLADLQKTETSDEAKRYAYAAQAGFPSKENAAKYFNDFTNNKDISESYIESATLPFNSTKHADLTLPYLEKALAELPNLKRNRKIFFVNGWLTAFIGGQKSQQALAIVNKFLADNPNLDRDLRLKVLEVSDGLERAVKIREKYGR